jgi:apolipoprotein N-acyltransferase
MEEPSMSLTSSSAASSVQPRRVDVITVPANQRATLQPSQLPRRLTLIPAVLGGLLLWMCFFPLAWGWLGWVALVPFLSLARSQATPRRIYLAAWLCGSVFFWPILQWMRVADPRMYATWAMLAVYCSLYFPVTLWLIRVLDRRTFLPLVLSVPIVWTAMEFVRSFLLTGFAWYYLGHTQHTFLSMIQIADLGGVYLISFLVAAVNAWIFDRLYQVPNLRDLCRWEEPRARKDRPLSQSGMRRGLVYEFGAILMAVIATLVYGGWRLSQNQFERGPNVTLLQMNVPQGVRNQAGEGQAGEGNQGPALKSLVQQSDALCKAALDYNPRTDLVVWPETSYFFPWLASSPNLAVQNIPPAFRRDEFMIRSHLSNELLKLYPTNHLLGTNTIVLGEQKREVRYNSAVLVRADGNMGERFDKMHRVPFGEYVPLRWLPFMDKLAPYDFDYSISPGERFTRFPLKDHSFGVLICYEDTDPFLARRYVRDEADGPPVDFLVNMSNDGWFDGTSEHEEHLAISRFRAVETRRAIVRSVNMGISALIDGNGRVLAPQVLPESATAPMWLVGDDARELPVGEWRHFKKTLGVLRTYVPIDSRSSVYAQTGDLLPGACWAVIFGVFGWTIATRRRSAAA